MQIYRAMVEQSDNELCDVTNDNRKPMRVILLLRVIRASTSLMVAIVEKPLIMRWHRGPWCCGD